MGHSPGAACAPTVQLLVMAQAMSMVGGDAAVGQETPPITKKRTKKTKNVEMAQSPVAVRQEEGQDTATLLLSFVTRSGFNAR